MYITRELEGKIRKYLDTPEIIAVTGARQTGKTTLLQHIKEGLSDSVFLTFEDTETRALFDTDLNSFIKIYIKPYQYIFIDEFQYAKKGGQSLKFIYDTVKDKKIIISGSSVIDITIKAVKHLAGRIFVFPLYPLTFKEFLSFKDPNLYNHYLELNTDRNLEGVLLGKYTTLLREFIIFGGYPRVVLSDDDEKKEVLKNILNIYLLRDVRDMLGLIDDYSMLNLIKAMSLQIGNVISYQELSTIAHQGVTAIRKYLSLLEKTYIVCPIRPFFTNKRLEIIKNPKVYFYDSGMRNSIINDFRGLDSRQDRGFLYENFIFSELAKKGSVLKYWRTKSKAEVDFIVNDKYPVEVKSQLPRATIGKSLYSFIEKYHPDTAFIFNENILKVDKVHKTEVKFMYHFYCQIASPLF